VNVAFVNEAFVVTFKFEVVKVPDTEAFVVTFKFEVVKLPDTEAFVVIIKTGDIVPPTELRGVNPSAEVIFELVTLLIIETAHAI
jgi:hypothetical protein